MSETVWKRQNILKSNRFWIFLLCGLLVISAIAVVVLRQGPADKAYVYLDGELIEILDLLSIDKPYSFTVECENGINIVTVERGRIRISDADCPDRSCVRQGWLSGGMTPIVCLPHKLVIELKYTSRPDVDAIVG